VDSVEEIGEQGPFLRVAKAGSWEWAYRYPRQTLRTWARQSTGGNVHDRATPGVRNSRQGDDGRRSVGRKTQGERRHDLRRCLEWNLVATPGGFRIENWRKQWRSTLDSYAVSASRMKNGRQHHVPLTCEATAIPMDLPRLADAPCVFLALRDGKLSDMSNGGIAAHAGGEG
jgi:hypothetical protein